MLTASTYRRVYRISAWYDLIVTWPFATPLTLALYWGPVIGPVTEALGLPPLPPLEAHTVLFANFFGSLVLIWSVLRLRRDDPRLAVYDGIGRMAFSAWMANALLQGASPLIWVFLIPEVGFGLLQLLPPADAAWRSYRRTRAPGA